MIRITALLICASMIVGAQTPAASPDDPVTGVMVLVTKAKADYDKANAMADSAAAILKLRQAAASADTNNSSLGAAVSTAQKDFESAQQALNSAVNELKESISNPVFLSRFVLNANQLVLDPKYQLPSLMSQLEKDRLDKQAGASSNSAGSTSLTSKGSLPSLLGFAVENGALTQAVSGTTITFSGKPVDVLNALIKKDYVRAAVTRTDQPLIRFLSGFGYSFTFDTSQGSTPGTLTGDRQQLDGFFIRYDIYNRRDPRLLKYSGAWNVVMAKQAALAGSAQALVASLQPMPSYRAWLNGAVNSLEEASASDLKNVVTTQYGIFAQTVAKDPDIAPLIASSNDAIVAFAKDRAAAIDRIANSWIWTLEYDNSRQKDAAAAAGATAMTGTTTTVPAPSLSSIKLIGETQALRLPKTDFTFNASATFFNNLPLVSKAKTLRDWRASAQFDTLLPQIANVGKPTLTFSGQVLRLLQEPLGEMVQINGITVTRTGTMGVAQVKLTFPVGSSGISIPISASWASRSELLPDKQDVRGNFGLTFDLDKLFSKAQ
jgi:hypothetical protein